MLKRTAMMLCAVLSLNSSIFAEEKDDFPDQEIEKLSYYMGYLIGRDHVKNSYGFPTHFDHLIKGIKAGMAGVSVEGQQDLIPLIKRMQKTIVEQQAVLNLKEAESYLHNLTVNRSELVSVVPSKLFYDIKQRGSGPEIIDFPLLHFKMSEWKGGEMHLLYSTYADRGEPLPIDFQAVIPGFSQGIEKMRIGEQRIIYIHPDLAFGLGKHDIAPNRLIIFEVTSCPDK